MTNVDGLYAFFAHAALLLLFAYIITGGNNDSALSQVLKSGALVSFYLSYFTWRGLRIGWRTYEGQLWLVVGYLVALTPCWIAIALGLMSGEFRITEMTVLAKPFLYGSSAWMLGSGAVILLRVVISRVPRSF